MFKVGDRVFDLRFGWGEVKEINEDTTYSVKVKFKLVSYKIAYTEQGKYINSDFYRSLFFEKIEVPANATTKSKFRADFGGRYYSVNHYGVIERSIERGYKTDSRLVEIGNYFKTVEEVKESKFYKAFHDGGKK
ncbi:MAG: hypothetical protein ACRC5T_03980 [Cetobacterium sp.]